MIAVATLFITMLFCCSLFWGGRLLGICSLLEVLGLSRCLFESRTWGVRKLWLRSGFQTYVHPSVYVEYYMCSEKIMHTVFITIFNGKTPCKWPFSIAFCMFTRGIQRVYTVHSHSRCQSIRSLGFHRGRKGPPPLPGKDVLRRSPDALGNPRE